jgi:hypothetical protein
MTNLEPDNGTTRDDLLQRVALMETMIAEGRRCDRLELLSPLQVLGLACLRGSRHLGRYRGQDAPEACRDP